MTRAVRGGVGVLVLLGAGEVVGRSGFVDPAYLPRPSTVLARLGGLLADGGFLGDVGVTVGSWLAGLTLAVAVAVPVGLLLGTLPGVNAAARIVVEFLRPIPSVALVPLAIVVLGLGADMRLAVVVYGAVWPILFNTIYALAEVDPLAKEAARSVGLGRLAVLLRVSLPSAAPFVATGVRLAAGIALILEISAELLGGGGAGLGGFVQVAQSGEGRMDLVLAAAAVTGVLGYASNAALEALSRRAFGWVHRSEAPA